MRGLGGAQALLLRRLARTLLAQLRLALGARLRLHSQALVAFGAQIGLSANARGRRRLALACLRALLGGNTCLVALLNGRAAGYGGLALLRLASSHRLALLCLASSHSLTLLLPGRFGLLLLLLANGALPGVGRLLVLLCLMLLRLRPRLGAAARLRASVGSLRHYRRHHRGRHQQGDHVPFHRVDSFIPSFPLKLAAESPRARDPTLNPLFTKEKYRGAGSGRRLERSALLFSEDRSR